MPEGATQHHVEIEPSLKRVRLVVNGKTIADSLCAALVRESGAMPVYYLPREDVRLDCLRPSDHRTHCPYKGEASYWNVVVGDRELANEAWSYEMPFPTASRIKDWIAFEWERLSHRYEEDEEVFGHPRDPYHRVDVRPSTREVRVNVGGEAVAYTRRALFLFETGLPLRYYVPAEDVRTELLVASRLRTVCPYKGQAFYWSIRVGDQSDQFVEDAVWSYPEPLPECPRIRGHFCFDPTKVDRLEVEGERAAGR